jgi:hypothetical protein
VFLERGCRGKDASPESVPALYRATLEGPVGGASAPGEEFAAPAAFVAAEDRHIRKFLLRKFGANDLLEGCLTSVLDLLLRVLLEHGAGARDYGVECGLRPRSVRLAIQEHQVWKRVKLSTTISCYRVSLHRTRVALQGVGLIFQTNYSHWTHFKNRSRPLGRSSFCIVLYHKYCCLSGRFFHLFFKYEVNARQIFVQTDPDYYLYRHCNTRNTALILHIIVIKCDSLELPSVTQLLLL